jgi:hypothetical protein
MRFGFIFAVAAAVVCGGSRSGAASPIWRNAEATVTIADVIYVLPSYWNTALWPRDPLCRRYEDFDMVIVGRELFINGVLAYQAKRFDKVYVVYPQGVQGVQGVIVNGWIARPRTHKMLDAGVSALCGSWD